MKMSLTRINFDFIAKLGTFRLIQLFQKAELLVYLLYFYSIGVPMRVADEASSTLTITRSPMW